MNAAHHYSSVNLGLPSCAMDRIRKIDSFAQWDIVPTIALYVAYSVIMVVVLLNLIIAVFNDTYSTVVSNAGTVLSIPLVPQDLLVLILSDLVL